ncbi:MAG: dicarboxylate/amino acid:cation symporter, partial [Puniceicoccales bacterium]|nr:dicarboxylate/amino acid:cation symporter [Puniceicoccales bacterium]
MREKVHNGGRPLAFFYDGVGLSFPRNQLRRENSMARAARAGGGFLSWYFKSSLFVRIFLGLLLGAAVGLLLSHFPDRARVLVSYGQFFGDIFIRLLKMTVVPIILFSLISGAASIRPSLIGRAGGKTLLYYFVSSALAVAIGFAVALLFRPGEGMHMVAEKGGPGEIVQTKPLAQIVLQIIPTNVFESLAKGDVLPVIFFALAVGIGLSALRDARSKNLARQAGVLYDVCSVAAEAMYKIVGGIMQYAPIGVFSIIVTVFARQGSQALGPLACVALTLYVGLILYFIIGFGGLLTLCGLNFVKFLRGAREPMVAAFVTRSSSSTLPLTMRAAEERLGVPRTLCSFILPIGATVSMVGTIIYFMIAVPFVGYATGMPLNGSQVL